VKTLLRIPGYFLALIRAIFAFFTILLYVTVYLVTIPLFGNTQERAFNLRRNWIKLGMRLFGIQVKHIGQPINKAALYVSNHLSFTDPIATCLHLNAFVIAKAEVANIPFLSKGAELTGVIYVKRESKTSRSNTRKALVDTLNSGKNILVYPEGTVSQDSLILPYKTGAFREAITNGHPVVPIAIYYRDNKDRWQKNTGIIKHFFTQLSYLKTVITHEIGDPITGTDGKLVAQRAHDWTQSKLIEWSS